VVTVEVAGAFRHERFACNDKGGINSEKIKVFLRSLRALLFTISYWFFVSIEKTRPNLFGRGTQFSLMHRRKSKINRVGRCLPTLPLPLGRYDSATLRGYKSEALISKSESPFREEREKSIEIQMI